MLLEQSGLVDAPSREQRRGEILAERDGTFLIEQGDERNAERAIQLLQGNNWSNNKEIQTLLARAYGRHNEYKLALKADDAVLRLDSKNTFLKGYPTNPTAAQELYQEAATHHNSLYAVLLYEQALSIAGGVEKLPRAQLEKGKILQQQGRILDAAHAVALAKPFFPEKRLMVVTKEAREIQSIQQQAEQIQRQRLQAEALLKEQKYQEALPLFQAIEKNYTGDIPFLVSLSEILLGIGEETNKTLAQEVLQRVKRLEDIDAQIAQKENLSIKNPYVLINVATGRALDANDEGRLYTEPLNRGDYQQWFLIDNPDGTYQLLHNKTKRALDVSADVERGGYIQLVNQQESQMWQVEPVTESIGTYYLIQKGTGNALDSNAEGKVYGHEQNKGKYQQWKLESLEQGSK